MLLQYVSLISLVMDYFGGEGDVVFFGTLCQKYSIKLPTHHVVLFRIELETRS